MIKKNDGQREELRMELRKENEEWRKDSAYISYVNSGESAAVFVVRDIEASINTYGKWIDIISFSTYTEAESGKRWLFHWIVAELFPRKLTPKYIDEDSGYDEEYIREYNRYLTWRTAHEDIEQQREDGYRGPMFLVLCDLVNINKNKFNARAKYAKKRWNPHETYRNKKIKESIESKWEYKIRDVKEVNDKQVKYIENHRSAIINKIMKNGKATLDILGIR